jgi:alpha-tubulin suppressor-like RCC1 family protein
VAAGYDHALAVGTDGKLYEWGGGEIGAPDAGPLVPTDAQLPRAIKPKVISAGDDFDLALATDGRVWAWGDNSWGQMGPSAWPEGMGPLPSSPHPVVVPLPKGTHATSVTAGNDFALAIGTNGRVYAWGDDRCGQLGNGKVSDNPIPKPVTVALPAGVIVKSVATGGAYPGVPTHNQGSFAVALATNGKAYAWGDDYYGQLGNGTQSFCGTTPRPVSVSLPPRVTARAIAAGATFALVLGSNGEVYAWGENLDGALGNRTPWNSAKPVRVALPRGVIVRAVAAGDAFALAIGTNGKLYGWGNNYENTLGNGTSNTTSYTPVVITLPGHSIPSAIAAGDDAGYAVVSG